MELPLGKTDVFLDDLVLQTILENIDDVKTIANAAAVCLAFAQAAHDVASDSLLMLLKRQRVLPLHQHSAGRRSVIMQLGTWASVEACTVLTLRADPKSLTLVRSEPPDNDFGMHRDVPRVLRMMDTSGHCHHVTAAGPDRRPVFLPDALGPGIGALDFCGSSILQTAPFATPLPQPISIMVVAKCHGDTTLVDSLTPTSARFELCHGYPSNTTPQPNAPAICISADGVGRLAPAKILRGQTRSNNNTWHVYTAIFDGDRSEMFVDGVREASGKSVGGSALDGLRIGCDHTSTFFLKGQVAELRLFACHLSDGPRAQMEAALALQYGLSPPPPPTPPQSRSIRYGCLRRVALRTAD